MDTQRESDYREKVELTISAAASLNDALEIIQHSYQEEHPEIELTLNFEGSGSLQQQFYNYLQSKESMRVFMDYGFTIK